jgi:AraC family transcriptional regulator
MAPGFAAVTDDDGVLVRSADVNGFTLSELQFPSAYFHGAFEPEFPYLALVLDGALEKTFPSRTMRLGKSSAFTIPAGATHKARFGPSGARIVIVKTRSSTHAVPILNGLAELDPRELGWLAWRLAAELRASDTAAPLAAEGLALELLAAASRERLPERLTRRPPPWLASAEELLRARLHEPVGLGQLADDVGVHPSHLARVFRIRHGVSVGEYGRRLRLAWAACEVAASDAPLAVIAGQAGFADQSHFTRLFKQFTGTTPARYRRAAQPGSPGD